MAALGGELKTLEGPGQTAICRGDLCIPLNMAGSRDTVLVEGTEYVYVDSLSEALTFRFYQAGGETIIMTNSSKRGLNPGDTPPEFALPDLFTGEMVSSTSYPDRKVIFYMWASW